MEGSSPSFVSEEVDQSLDNIEALKRKASWCGDDEDVTSKELESGCENEGENEKKNGNEEEKVVQTEKGNDGQANKDIARKMYIEGIPSRCTRDKVQRIFDTRDTITEVHCMNFSSGKLNENAAVTFENAGDELLKLHHSFDCTDAFTTDKVFSNREALITWAREVGKDQGFVIVIKASEPGGVGRKPRLRLACERSGSYRQSKNKPNTEKLHRKGVGTKKCACPFEMQGVKLEKDDEWGVKVIFGMHNHLAIKQLEGHSFAGRLTAKEKIIVADMTKNMVKPKNILMTLKQHDEKNVTIMKTIYNARQRYKFIEKARRSQMQQFMEQLNECKYIEWHRSDEATNCVRDLFWTHPTAIDLLHAFPSILIIDCTCKTNRYRLPLLEIVGVTSTNLTFSIAFVYIEAECVDSYTWAMEKLRSLMPVDSLPAVIVTDKDLALMSAVQIVFPSTINLLCRWHISKNLLANCKNFFEREERWEAFMSAWNVLVFSLNENEYERNLSLMVTDYHTYPRVLQYVKDTWLNQYKERFVAAWTDKIMHFGIVTTNRVEGAHAKLKRHLGSSQGDFETSWNTINSLIELQHTEIKASFERSLTIVEQKFSSTLFRELLGLVSRFALDMILREANRANQIEIDHLVCDCVMRSTHGLPCAHEIANLIREGRSIPLSTVHSHWTRLDLMNVNVSDLSSELTIDAEFDLILRYFNACDEAGKLTLKRKLRELSDPATTLLVPPRQNVKIKDRSTFKTDASTRHNASSFEIVQSGYDSITTPLTVNSVKMTDRKKLSVHRTFDKCKVRYIDCFPKEIHQYIHSIVDVEADGHCGFRAIAGLLGMGLDGWSQVRRDLIEQINSFRDDYVRLYGSIERVDELLQTLSCFDASVSHDKWMTLPDMGHLIASHYSVVLVQISARQCLTYFPLRSAPPLTLDHRVIVIGFVNDCHFVQVFMDPVAPIPPVACSWRKYRYDCARGWELPYVARMEDFKLLFWKNSDVATQETIELDKS